MCCFVFGKSFAAFSVRWKLFKFRKLGLDKTDKRQSTAVQIERYLRKDMLPVLGALPMDRIGKADVLRVLRSIEARGALSIAEKCRSWLFELFQHALAEGLIGGNPAAEMAVLALPKNPTQHNPFLRQEGLPAFLVKLSGYQGSIQTRLGILLLLLTGERTGELRQAPPAEGSELTLPLINSSDKGWPVSDVVYTTEKSRVWLTKLVYNGEIQQAAQQNSDLMIELKITYPDSIFGEPLADQDNSYLFTISLRSL